MARTKKAQQAKDDVAAAERAKYMGMWRTSQYRVVAPGEALAALATSRLRMAQGSTVLDAGTGTGRAAAALQQAGMDVWPFDIAENCMDEDAPEELRERLALGTLWDAEAVPGGMDYVFCTDVMEHLPEDRVDDALYNLAQAGLIGAFFQVATHADGCGKLIGETLHLTVQPLRWWLPRFKAHWRDVAVVQQQGNGFILVCHH